MTDSYSLSSKIYIQIHADSMYTLADSYILETLNIPPKENTINNIYPTFFGNIFVTYLYVLYLPTRNYVQRTKIRLLKK